MLKRWTGPLAVLSVVLAPLAARADDAAKTDAPELSRWTRTGQYETCLTSHLIQNSRILNSHQILFEMSGGVAYLAEPQNCPGLSRTYALAYDATLDRLCNTTIIHLIEPGSPVPERGACGIERFEKLDKKKAN